MEGDPNSKRLTCQRGGIIDRLASARSRPIDHARPLETGGISRNCGINRPATSLDASSVSAEPTTPKTCRHAPNPATAGHNEFLPRVTLARVAPDATSGPHPLNARAGDKAPWIATPDDFIPSLRNPSAREKRDAPNEQMKIRRPRCCSSSFQLAAASGATQLLATESAKPTLQSARRDAEAYASISPER